jgi:hypothetical protein
MISLFCRFITFTCLCLWFSHSILFAEDVKLREEAVRLMERANQVSLPGPVPNYEQVVSFRVHYPDGAAKEGSYSRVSAGAAGYREEESFGDFHAITVRSGDRISSTVGWEEPPEMRELREQLPVHLGRFDHEDVIRSIESTSLQGRPSKCILFDTHFGEAVQQNQVCVDAERGAMLHWQVGADTIDNYDYFKVGDLWQPAHITRNVRGALRMEIEQKVSILESTVDSNMFVPPTSQWNKLYSAGPDGARSEFQHPSPHPEILVQRPWMSLSRA